MKKWEYKPMGTMWGRPVEGVFEGGKEIGYLEEGRLHIYKKKRRRK